MEPKRWSPGLGPRDGRRRRARPSPGIRLVEVGVGAFPCKSLGVSCLGVAETGRAAHQIGEREHYREGYANGCEHRN